MSIIQAVFSGYQNIQAAIRHLFISKYLQCEHKILRFECQEAFPTAPMKSHLVDDEHPVSSWALIVEAKTVGFVLSWLF